MSTITIKEKRMMLGDSLTVTDLLSALKDEIFMPKALITIQTEKYQGVLVAAYQVEGSDDLYLLANNYNLLGQTLYKNHEILEILMQISDNVVSVENELNRECLISALEKLPRGKSVYIQTVGDVEENIKYNLTGVYKCREGCSSIHLDCSYSEYFFSVN